MSKRPLISHDHAAGAIEDALRLRVGRGRRYSFAGLSDATGIPVRTLESYVQGATPSLHALLSLCSVLGPSFASDVLAPCGLSAQESNVADPEHLKVLASLGALVATLSAAIADGHVDHREAAQLRPLAMELVEKLQPMTQVAS